MAIDSNGNVHIAYCTDYETRDHEIWYTMRDNNGNTLIDDRPLTPDDGVKPIHATSSIFCRQYIHITCCEDREDCVKTVDEGRRDHVVISAEILT